MRGDQLREAREARSWTQQEAAERLGVSQAYLSMWEQGKRAIPAKWLRVLIKTYGLSGVALPLQGPKVWARTDAAALAAELSGVGYAGFAHLSSRTTLNPADLLLAALTKSHLEARITEALPWLVTCDGLDWDWAVREAKIHDVQNRLGFVIALGRQVAERAGKKLAAERLSEVESKLRPSLLAAEQTLCHEDMTQAERRSLREHSTPDARQWNLLSDLRLEHLDHA